MNFSKTLTRRAVLAGAGAFRSLYISNQMTWPGKPMKLIMPFALAGSNDGILIVVE